MNSAFKESQATASGDHISRRKFLRWGLTVGVGAGVGYIERKYLKEKYEEVFDLEKVQLDIEARCGFLKSEYGLEIDFTLLGLEKENIKGQMLSVEERRDILKWLMPEIAKYPPEYIKQLEIGTVHFMRNYSREGNGGNVGPETKAGFLERREAGIVKKIPRAELINIDITDDLMTPSYHNPILSAPNSVESLHHELGHADDYRFATRESTREFGKKGDGEWTDINPSGEFAYIGEWANGLSSTIYDYDNRRPKGFVCGYGRKGPGDDRATVRQLLMVDATLAKSLYAIDPVLAAKIDVLKKNLCLNSNGKMNEEYWKKLEEGKVNFAHWGIGAGKEYNDE